MCPLRKIIDICSVSGFCKQLRHIWNFNNQNISYNSQKSESCSSSSRSSQPFIHSVLINTHPPIPGYFLCWTSLAIEVTCLARVVVCTILLWHTSLCLQVSFSWVDTASCLPFQWEKYSSGKRKKCFFLVTSSLLSSARSISPSGMGDEMGPAQKNVLQPRHQALLVKSNLRYFPLSELSAGVMWGHFYAAERFHNYWLICFLGCIDRVWEITSILISV